MRIERLNGKAWDEESRKKNFWTNGLTEDMKEKLESGKQSIWVTPKSDVPFSWLEEKGNGKALNLGGGGGQQTVILSRLGFSVTTIDVSERQIRKDKKALEEYGLAAELINGDMRDLSMFEDESFSLVISPQAVNFISDVQQFYKDIYRVLRKDGIFIIGFANPILYIFDREAENKGKLKVKYTIPYSDERSLSKKERKRKIMEKDTFEYSHTLSSLIGGLCREGFVIEDMFSDDSLFEPVDSFLSDSFIALKARKSAHFPQEEL